MVGDDSRTDFHPQYFCKKEHYCRMYFFIYPVQLSEVSFHWSALATICIYLFHLYVRSYSFDYIQLCNFTVRLLARLFLSVSTFDMFLFFEFTAHFVCIRMRFLRLYRMIIPLVAALIKTNTIRACNRPYWSSSFVPWYRFVCKKRFAHITRGT